MLVVIRSPMYFCKNLLWLSSLSCSSLTASILLKRIRRDSWSALACLQTVSEPHLPPVRVLCLTRLVGHKTKAAKNSPLQLLSGLLAEYLDVFARSSRAHGSHVVCPKWHIDGADG